MILSLILFRLLFAEWSGPQLHGVLDKKILKEASGLVWHQDSWWQVNDSGDGPFVYKSDDITGPYQKINYIGAKPFDVESLAIADCFAEKCLVVGDIGDNYHLRDRIRLYFLRMSDLNKKEVVVSHILQLRYPQQARNAEAMSFAPNGDLIIVTKEEYDKEVKNAQVFRLASNKVFSKEVEVLEFVKELPILDWLKSKDRHSYLVTGLDIAEDGVWYLLTYHHIIILQATSKMQDWSKTILPFSAQVAGQAEAIVKNGNLLYVTSETSKRTKGAILVWANKKDRRLSGKAAERKTKAADHK
tara:strand:+ start:10664 stop:11566 length:903 start_codon:yes stop_codon:yes gene_type:complete